ncbi:MAG: cell division protein ZipA C-terminal FtsZ-binding domain-containing protein [Nitrosomonadales bacterium]|nr:cell division protein ZipA C-terminal FtsZ-binding domain-containing protein [Nitrosomonadales bacterium]
MSELQAALLAIGLGVIVAVYAFGWWQQRRYRHKFGKAFTAPQADALYQQQEEVAQPTAQVRKQEAVNQADAVSAAISVADRDEGAPGVESSATTMLDESCALLDPRSDFVIELHLVEASPAAALNGLWHRKFDFGKPVQVCGLTLGNKKWERAIADSQTLYSHFRIALQLVDRGGAISAAKLADFRDLVQGIATRIKADTTAPDIQKTYLHAQQLDAFCAEADQMVGVNLVPPGDKLIPAARIVQATARLGMTLEADGAFHLLNAHGQSLFSLINQNSVPFQHYTLETFSTAGITLLLDVPRVENPVQQFDYMVRVAHELVEELNVKVVDDHQVEISANGLALIRARLADVEAKMCTQGIAPGSAQARRLFS